MADLRQQRRQIFFLFRLIGIEDAISETERPSGALRPLLRSAPRLHLLAERCQHDELCVTRTGLRPRFLLRDLGGRPVPLLDLGQPRGDGDDVHARERFDAVDQAALGQCRERRQIERLRAGPRVDRAAPIERRGQVVSLLGDGVAGGLELLGRFHQLHERTLDVARQRLLVDRLSAERAAAVERSGFDQPLGFAHERRPGQQLAGIGYNQAVPGFERAGVHARRAQRLDLGEQALAFRRLLGGRRAGSDRGGDPCRIDHLVERRGRIDTEHRADLLQALEHGLVGDRFTAGRERPPARLDLFVGGLGFLAQLVARALQILAQALDRVEAEDLDERLPFLGLGLVDEVGERASAQQERLAPGGMALRRPLVWKRRLAAERSARHHLDRGDVVAVTPDVPDRMLASLVLKELDLAGEVPLQCVGDGALAGSVVAVDGNALALAEVHDHLAGDAAERAHDQAVDPFSHR